MEDRFIIKNGRKLRYGYTTGSCATAASKAATAMLCSGTQLDRISIMTPKGWELDLELHDVELGEDYAVCAIQKDSGDDPDVTDGILIYSKATFNDSGENEVKGGIGVGVVTRKGLPPAQGGPAINPGPMNMIMSELKAVNNSGKGVTVEISIPKGVEIARKTFNPRLGIEGGISILGTTGIVEPMSNEAIKESLALELSMLKEKGFDRVILVPGNYGRDMLTRDYEVPNEVMITTSNFMGYMLGQAVYYGFKEMLIAGSIGKLVKVAAGIFDTHSRVSDARVEILTANYAIMGGSRENMEKIMTCLTTEEALDYIDIPGYYEVIADKIKKRSEIYLRGEGKVETALFSTDRGLLSLTEGAMEIIEYLKGKVNG